MSSRGLALCLAAIAAFLLFSFGAGRDSYVRINDNLDGFVPLYRVLASQHPVVGALDEQVPALLDGLPRNSMPSTVNPGVLLFYVLPPLAALAVGEAVVRVIAFLGMLLLLRRHVLPRGDPLVVYGASLCFALLPFLPSHYLSVAGQPLLLHAVLELRAGRGSWRWWGFVALFAVYSSLVYIGLFVLLAAGLLLLHDLWRTRRLGLPILGVCVLMTALFAASEYRLIYQTLFASDYTSFRTLFDRPGQAFLGAIRVVVMNTLVSQHHAGAVQLPVILGTIAAGLVSLALRRDPGDSWGTALRRLLETPLARLALAIGAISLVVGVYRLDVVQVAIRDAGIPLLRTFNFQRIQWFHPLLFGLGFAVALELLRTSFARGRVVVGLLLGLQVAVLVASDDAVQEARETGLSFREFYATALFDEIRDHIGRPQADYRVVSLGLMPGIPLYNGFHALDGFLNDYSVAYKARFRKVVAGELERDAWLREHFDGWGAHLILYSHELGMVVGYRKSGPYTKDHGVRAIHDLALDTRALRALGADYVLSAIEVENADALGWNLEGVFEREDLPWRIHLYALAGVERGDQEREARSSSRKS